MYVYMFMESVILIILVYMIFYIISYKINMNMESVSCYECGFEPKTKARLMFSYRFFLISILFLIFDVEISLMIPIPYFMGKIQGEWLFFMFIMIIMIGLFYEYYYGSLNWLQ